MKRDWRAVVAILLASALVLTLLAGVGGIIWRGSKISTAGTVIIGMLVGAIVTISAIYLGYLASYYSSRSRTNLRIRQLPGAAGWALEEDTLDNLEQNRPPQ